MSELRVLSLSPFVPSGKHHEASRRLLRELGFEEIWESDGYAGFRNGDAKFILQNFDNDAFAQNFMIRIDVPNLEACGKLYPGRSWRRAYPEFRINLPKDFPWGREVHLIDLAGVCWHVGES